MAHFWEMFQYIIQGAGVSVKIYTVTIITSIPLGILFAIGKVSRFRLLNWFFEAYTWLFRGTPLLLQLYFFAYGVPALGISISKMMAAFLAFSLNYTAYFCEIFRGGIISIDKGQFEAAKALGMPNHKIMSRIVVPQALKKVLPPVGNEAITLIKDTALVAAIALGDILRHTKEIVSRTFKVDAFLVAAIIYLVFTYVVVYIFRRLEKRYAYYD